MNAQILHISTGITISSVIASSFIGIQVLGYSKVFKQPNDEGRACQGSAETGAAQSSVTGVTLHFYFTSPSLVLASFCRCPLYKCHYPWEFHKGETNRALSTVHQRTKLGRAVSCSCPQKLKQVENSVFDYLDGCFSNYG